MPQTVALALRYLALVLAASRENSPTIGVSDERPDERRTAGDSRRHANSHLHPVRTRSQPATSRPLLSAISMGLLAVCGATSS